jgi:RNA polymerase-interacting CarD/CdnL/TRCF family regulator
MAFKIGDTVVLADHGVGKVVRLEEKRFAGAAAKRYYEVNTARSTIWVPAEGDSKASLRALISHKELARYRRVLISTPSELDADRRQRQLEVMQRLKQNSFQLLCEVVRDLSARGWRKPLNETDTLALRKARESLCEEWSMAAGIPLADAMHEVDGLLSEAKHAHAA